MRPRLGPVLPGMRSGVDADKVVLPVGRRAGGIISLQRFVVIDPSRLSPKMRAKAFEKLGITHDAVPIIMAALVAKMTDERAIRFLHRQPRFFPVEIVGFRDGMFSAGDDPVLRVPRDDGRQASAVGVEGVGLQETEAEPAMFGLSTRFSSGRRSESRFVNEPALGCFGAAPERPVFRSMRQIGNHLVQAAGETETCPSSSSGGIIQLQTDSFCSILPGTCRSVGERSSSAFAIGRT